METNELLLNGLKKINLKQANNINGKSLSEENYTALSALLNSYIKELKMFNASFNLVKIKDDKELIVSHILDSLSAAPFFSNEINNLNKCKTETSSKQKTFYIADAGSGAGFPGIPLAVFFTTSGYSNVKLNLIERMKKRCSFLQNIKAVLQLKNIEIIESEIEQAAQNKFDIVTCRAFRTLDKHILHSLLACTKPKGKLFLYKATQEKLQEETQLIKNENLNYKIEELFLPFSDKERRLLIIEKP